MYTVFMSRSSKDFSARKAEYAFFLKIDDVRFELYMEELD
jgi:hypothetical protein